ncbi:MAG TPA: translocation/assembly module TamB domain-containing protein [Vicinamibacterales bacterium]|nr:translocation/assembly module TamB domain-containing protein [Vicinamibacterales bacterium]
MKFLQRLRGHKVLRYASLGLTFAVALLAAAIVASLTIDLGPSVRARAERAGSDYIERPLHIGGLSIHLLTGRVLVDDLRIDGLHPGDRPFFTAKRIAVALDWLPAIARRPDITITSVEMTDWQMLVERWEGAHNFPRFNHDDGKPPGPKRVTTTLKWLRASRGQFTYEDHETPWGVVCPDLDINITNLPNYHGTATFTKGTVTIQDFVPMWASMKAQFVIDGPRIHLPHIDLDSDGAKTALSGDVDMGHWPNQGYRMHSRVNFPRMRELFFKDASWMLSGDGDFDGTFRLYKSGENTNRDLSGSFSSTLAGLNDYRFPQLYGSLRWTQDGFDVWNAGSQFYGGSAQFVYSIKPFGQRVKPTHRFDTTLAGVDLAQFTDFEQLRGQRFAGAASLRNHLEWPSGHFDQHRGDGQITVTPPPGVTTMTGSLAAARADDVDHTRHEWGPFSPVPLAAHLPIGGALAYAYGPDEITLTDGRFATERTFVTFAGTTAYGDASRLPFHVTSSDWQESDQLLAGIMTDFGAPTGPVPFGGRGEFDGLMSGPFRRPRVEGLFTGEDLRAFDTLWGGGRARIVVENKYVNVTDGVVSLDDSVIRADGLFSLGYPRDDDGDEINARLSVTRRDVDSLRHAFGIDDYPVSGKLSGEFHLTGAYERPVGFGSMTIDDGVAYGEPFQKATSSLRFDGRGVRLDNLNMTKDTGSLNAAAFVGWDSTYSFDADGRRIPVEHLAFLQYPRAQLAGLADFTATGSGTFDAPRNDFRFRVADMSIGEETIGQVNGTLALRGRDLSGEVDAASPRLALTGTGRISLAPHGSSELTFRFHDTSLDPYVRLFVPKLSPYTTAVATGALRVVGELSDPNRLLVDGTVDTFEMRLLDYAIRNGAPIRIALDKQTVRVDELQLVGEDTRLRVSGSLDLNQQRIALTATGDAGLGILQGFFRDVRGAGRAMLTAAINGPLDQPQFSGSATITDGRVRHFSVPNSLDAINGTIRFDPGGIRLDDVSATLGGGRVQFGGRVGLDGYVPGDIDVTIRGEEMHLRIPEGVRSVVDADLSLRGNYKAPTLGGIVTVRSAMWNRRIDTPGSIFDLATRRSGSGVPVATGEPPTTLPLKFDVQLLIPSSLRIENNLARLVASADLTMRGTYDRPAITGHADIERGDVTFEGRRYRITHGTMDFTNPSRIEPFFDIEAETNVRVPGQTYRVTVAAAGTSEQLRPTLNSDPPLPTADVLALLFSDVRRGTQDVAPELRALQSPNQAQTDILAARATQAIAAPLSSEVGKVVEQTFGVDTFQITPSLVDPTTIQGTSRLNPTARVTVGKRISDRVYLTFSRSLGTTINDQIVLLEIEESDRLSWILSRNEDAQTYALEFRVRHVF